jgi:hypothetical protein
VPLVTFLPAGLERIYRSDPLTDPEFFDGFVDAMPRADGPFKNLLLGLAFFHCVVVGRRWVLNSKAGVETLVAW